MERIHPSTQTCPVALLCMASGVALLVWLVTLWLVG